VSEQLTESAGAQTATDQESQPLVRAGSLTKVFGGRGGRVVAVNRVSLDVWPGQTVGVVGESGSGKSTLARLIMRLVEPTEGTIQWRGADLLALRGRELAVQRRRMQMIFQSPYGSLLPAYTAAANIIEPLRIHSIGSTSQRRERALSLLELVGLSPRTADAYPRNLSGGQQQRVAIARALALEPDLLVCDEPTSALDMSIQAQIIALLERLQAELGFSMLFITHNLAVVERLADHIIVMRNGRIVEANETEAIFARPQQEYTRMLLDAVLPVRPPDGEGHRPAPVFDS
jgi:ABC-type glutathione transport system ATPase component